MDIKEIKEKRNDLAAAIAEMVSDFQRETGVVVTRVELEHMWEDEHERPYQTYVDVRIALEPE